jgi:RND family efflux transporter MFP subunit
MRRTDAIAFICIAAAAFAEDGQLATVIARSAARTIDLPAEIRPYLDVSLTAKVPGYVERVLVDRGSIVKQGDVLVELAAPELLARIAEAEARLQSAEADRAQADAQLAATKITAARLRKAAETPGAVAGIELEQSQKQVEAAEALVRSREQGIGAARSALQAQKDLETYLRITAPFDGVVVERMAHPGGLAGTETVLLDVQQLSRLRVVVGVPEEYAGSITKGAWVVFHVPAFPDRTFTAAVARVARVLDQKTRTMPVELEVANPSGALAPGMYPTVKWPVHSAHAVLMVPRTAVVTTSERTFVIRDRDGRAEWVDVRKGAVDGDLIEIAGPLRSGDRVLRRATDETREGAAIQ